MRTTILASMFAASMWLVSPMAQAAPLNLSPGEPDIYGQLDLSFVGASGSLTADGDSEPTAAFFYTDSSLGLSFSGFYGNYDLSASFDGSGAFTGGSLSIVVDGGSIPGVATTNDTVVSATLNDFGFTGTDAAGVLEFTFNVTGGKWFDTGIGAGGAIIHVTLTSGAPAGAWDSSLFTQDWGAIGTGTNSDTFAVPEPASLWMVGGLGLLVLTVVRPRRRRNVN